MIAKSSLHLEKRFFFLDGYKFNGRYTYDISEKVWIRREKADVFYTLEDYKRKMFSWHLALYQKYSHYIKNICIKRTKVFIL